jgi:hypothetical protein
MSSIRRKIALTKGKLYIFEHCLIPTLNAMSSYVRQTCRQIGYQMEFGIGMELYKGCYMVFHR